MQDNVSTRSSAFAVIRSMLVLALIVLLPRFVVLYLAVSPARDAIRYWSAADLFVTQPFLNALRGADCYPIYPFTLAVLKWAGLADTPELWWRSSQLWSLACYFALLTFAFLLGRRVWGMKVAWWGVALISLLPRQLRYSVDVLSDNLSAALAMFALWLIVEAWSREPKANAVDRKETWLLLVAGLAIGLASLTRIESLVVAISFVAAMISRMFLADRINLGRCSIQLATFILPVVILISGYVGLRGELSPRNTARAILSQQTMAEREHSPISSPEPTEWKTPIDAWMPIATGKTGGEWLAVSMGEIIIASLRACWEFMQETRGIAGLFFVIGLIVWCKDSTLSSQKLIILWLIAGSFAVLVVCRWKVGFVAGRYLMMVLPLVGMVAVKGIEWMLARLRTMSFHRLGAVRLGVFRADRWAIGAVTLVAIGLCVPGWFGRLHADRAGHRAAADWLLANTKPGEFVFDPSWVSAYFSGRPMTIPILGQPTEARYAIIDTSLLASPPTGLADSINFAHRGRIMAEFPKRPGSKQIGVRIVELPLPVPSSLRAN